MRILHILNDVTDRGNGIVNAAIDLSAGQVLLGHSVLIVSSGGGHEPLLEHVGIHHSYLEFGGRPTTMIKALLGIRSNIRKFKPDVVHTHTRTGLLLAWFWSWIMRFPLVAHVHNVHENESLLMTLADRVIAVSASVATTMNEKGIPRRKIRTVLNGPLGSPRLSHRDELAVVELQRPAIVTVCGMNHRKGVSELIRAFNLVAETAQDAHLYLIGDGPEMKLFQDEAKQSIYSNRIHFTGFQFYPQPYMRAADVFVLASRRESIGLVLLEARQMGCAIVASDVDGIPEALDGGAAGMLVPPCNVERLAEAIRSFVTSKEERESWQQKALHGLDRFGYLTMARNVDSVYEELLQRSSVARRRGDDTTLSCPS